MEAEFKSTLNQTGEFCIKFRHYDKDDSVIQQQLGRFIAAAERTGVKLVKTGGYVDTDGKSWGGYAVEINTELPKNGSPYKTNQCQNTNGRIEQLIQLLQITWDGDLISKFDRDLLREQGLCTKFGAGWNLITEEGVSVLYKLGYIHP